MGIINRKINITMEYLSKKEQARLETEEEIRSTVFNTLNGKLNLAGHVAKVGIKNKVLYFNMVERKAPKKEWSILKPTVVKKVIHDYGLIFNDNIEIRHVSKKIFDFYSNEIIEKRERNPNV